MKMTDKSDPNRIDPAAEAELDALLADLAATPEDPSDGFLARIEADALAQQPKPRPAAPTASTAQGRGWFRLDLGLGGWTSLGGLTAALVVGFGLGFSAPDTVSTFSSGLVGDSTSGLEDVFWNFDASLLEG